jgi:DNA mismatch repair protein MutS
MADELSHLRIYTMAISDDKQGEIVFLHRVTPGSIGRSYGVYVAKLAGMPPSIVRRAEEVLKQLESSGNPSVLNLVFSENGHKITPDGLMVAEANGRYEWQSEEASRAAQALEQAHDMEPDLDAIDICAITPLDALNLLFLMQKKRSRL